MKTKFANSIEARELGNVVSVARANKHLTQDQLAKECGLTQTSIALIENGKTRPHIASLIKIANVLEVPAMNLLNIIVKFDSVDGKEQVEEDETEKHL